MYCTVCVSEMLLFEILTLIFRLSSYYGIASASLMKNSDGRNCKRRHHHFE